MRNYDKIFNLYELADREGVLVRDFDIGVDKSLIIRNQDFCAIALNNVGGRKMPASEELCCLAHEMGHQQTGGFYSLTSSPRCRRKAEYKATKWATEYVLDFEDIQDVVDSGVVHTCEMASELGVTEEFLINAISYYELKELYIRRNEWA